MSQNSKIEWTDHTFNPWWGCVEVPLPSGSACDHCYAREFAKRFGVKWGTAEERRMASENVWAQPEKWNRAAKKAGVRARVFCGSMMDVFEPRPELDQHRKRLRNLITDTPHLQWLLLTKRPAYAADWIEKRSGIGDAMVGVTVESQEAFLARRGHIEALSKVTNEALSKVTNVFLSCEPMLSAITFPDGWLRDHVKWVICGGESGRGARPMHPDWARSLRDQCQAASVPFFFKQWGEWVPTAQDITGIGVEHRLFPDGTSMPWAEFELAACWSDDEAEEMARTGKKNAGRLLDGREWSEFPKEAHGAQE